MGSDDFKKKIDTEEKVTITKKQYDKLLDRDEWLDCLISAGVDNWEGYDYAIDLWNENNKDKDRPAHC